VWSVICPIKQASSLRRGRKKQLVFSGKLGEKQEEKMWSLSWDWSSQIFGIEGKGVKNQETGVIRQKNNVPCSAQIPTLLTNTERSILGLQRAPLIHCSETRCFQSDSLSTRERRVLPSGRSPWGIAIEDPWNSVHFSLHCLPSLPGVFPNNKARIFVMADTDRSQFFQEQTSVYLRGLSLHNMLQCPIPRALRQRMRKED